MIDYLKSKGFTLNHYDEGSYWEYVIGDYLGDDCVILQADENLSKFVISVNMWPEETSTYGFMEAISKYIVG